MKFLEILDDLSDEQDLQTLQSFAVFQSLAIGIAVGVKVRNVPWREFHVSRVL